MSFSHTITQKWNNADGREISAATTYSGDGQGPSLDVTVPPTTNDMEVAFALDVSQIQAIYILSDQDVTLETNSSSAADETIALQADVPYLWTTDSYDACLLATDITALFLTNAGATAANVQIEVVYDSTP